MREPERPGRGKGKRGPEEGGSDQMSYRINHQVSIKASPEEIYKAFTETEKVAQRWTTDTRGCGAKVGDTVEFWF